MADARSPEGLRYINRILIVRLGSLGDIVHALPVAAALRRALPDARIDWVVDERHRELLDLVPVVGPASRLADPLGTRLAQRSRADRRAAPRAIRRRARSAGADQVGSPGAGGRRAPDDRLASNASQGGDGVCLLFGDCAANPMPHTSFMSSR